MPYNQSVGLAGVTSLNGMVYVAGGVSAKDRSDSTDRLLRYDPVNDSWTQMANMNNQRYSSNSLPSVASSLPTAA